MAQTALNRPLVYLAGPDVFYPDPQAVAVRKKNILSEMGMAGLFPLDNEISATGEPPKCELLAQCAARGLPVISAMGAAARTDPAALRLGTVWDTAGCPLARTVRHTLRARGVTAAIPAVYSTEPPRETFDPAALGEQAEEYLQRGRRRRVLPSMGMLPGIVGLMAANFVVAQLCASSQRLTFSADLLK